MKNSQTKFLHICKTLYLIVGGLSMSFTCSENRQPDRVVWVVQLKVCGKYNVT